MRDRHDASAHVRGQGKATCGDGQVDLGASCCPGCVCQGLGVVGVFALVPATLGFCSGSGGGDGTLIACEPLGIGDVEGFSWIDLVTGLQDGCKVSCV